MKKKKHKKNQPRRSPGLALLRGVWGVGAQRCGRGAAPGGGAALRGLQDGDGGPGGEKERREKREGKGRGDGRKEGEAESRGAAGTCARSVTHALQRGRIQAAAPRGRAGSSEDTDGSRLRTARCRPAPPRPPPHEAPGLRVLA